MSDLRFLLDTNVIVRLLKHDAATASFLDGHGVSTANAAISQITCIELLSFPGLEQDEEARILAFLSQCAVLPISEAVEQAAIDLRRRTRAKLPDAIIAATAVTNGLKLLTFDDRLARLAS